MNALKSYQSEKQKLRRLCQEAVHCGFIEEKDRIEIEQKLSNEVLTIGVIGQMKAGKSTFLNTFVFGRDVLPAATTPMTAALTIITYGEEERLEAEFYTKEEWAEQLQVAKQNIDEVPNERKSKIQVAQELVQKSHQLGDQLDQLLGQTKTDTLDKLIDYVGADGRFVSITKAVKIYYPKEELKEVEIVDTPGFNDPIVSREERTKEFLKKADAILMLLYAGRPFDATDREIIFKHVSQCGAGKLVIGINKYDMPVSQGETEAEIKEYVIDEIKKACKGSNDTSLTEMLQATEPIPFSAEMALLSHLPMSVIQASDRYGHAWNRYVKLFEISTQLEFWEKSLFSDLSARVQEIIMKEKGEILLAKPLNRICSVIKGTLEDTEHKIVQTKQTVTNLSLPDEELMDKENKQKRATKRIQKETEASLDELKEELVRQLRGAKNRIENELDSFCDSAIRIINNEKRTASPEKMTQDVEYVLTGLFLRVIPREKETLRDARKRCIKDFSHLYIDSVSEITNKYLEDLDARSLYHSLERICEEEQCDDLLENDVIEESLSQKILRYTEYFLEELFTPIVKAARFTFGNERNKRLIKDKIQSLRMSFDINDELERIINIEQLTNRIKIQLFDEFLIPLQNELKEIQEQKQGRDQKLAKAEIDLVQLKKEKEELVEKVDRIKAIDPILSKLLSRDQLSFF